MRSARPLFFRGPSPAVRLVVCIALSAALMVADHRGGRLDAVRATLSGAVYPVHWLVSAPFDAVRWARQRLVSRQTLVEENLRLRHQQLLLRSQLEKFAQLESENRRLRHLLASSKKISDRVLVGELLAVDLQPFSRRVLINRGAAEGVKEGLPVIDAHGIMGQIIDAGPVSSTALLITDPDHAVPVRVLRTGYRSLAVGLGRSSEIALSHVPNNVDVRSGDLIVTSGLGGRFPPGYPVGRVAAVERDTRRPFAEVRVRPSARLDRSSEVLIVIPGSVEGERGAFLDSRYARPAR